MEINREPLNFDASYYSAEWDVARSEGIHLMQIVELMDTERNEVLGIKVNKNASPDELEAYRFGGFMYEHLIAQHIIDVECERMPEKLMRPGEYFWCYVCKKSLALLDPQRLVCASAGHAGIYATPDGLRTDTWTLKEWKFTWKSMKRAGADNDMVGAYDHIRDGIWKWIIQIMAYCYLIGTNRAELEVFFVNGDYTNRTPQIMRFTMIFEPQELAENWGAIVNKAEEVGWLA
jgi:hypothetical protein